MQQTPNIYLNKPDYEDVVDISVLNQNFDKIDNKIHEVSTLLDNKMNNSEKIYIENIDFVDGAEFFSYDIWLHQKGVKKYNNIVVLSLNFTRNHSFYKKHYKIEDIKLNHEKYEFKYCKIGTLPEGFRPKEYIVVPVYCYNMDYTKFVCDIITINEDGVISFINHAGSTPTVIHGIVSYFTF